MNISPGQMRRQQYCLMLLHHIKMSKQPRGRNGNGYENGTRNYMSFSSKDIQKTLRQIQHNFQTARILVYSPKTRSLRS